MKIYIVYIVPDYNGIDILKVFSNKEFALQYVDYYNSTDKFASKYSICKADWEEYEVLDNFERSLVDG